MLNLENPRVFGFRLIKSTGVRCDACSCFVPRRKRLHVHVSGYSACSPVCASELLNWIDAGIENTVEPRLGPSVRRRGAVPMLAAAGMR